jgi:hypothetical protein
MGVRGVITVCTPIRLNGVVRDEPFVVQLLLHSATCINIYTTVHYRTALRGWFFGALTKLRKATISIVMSVRPRGTTLLPFDGFS